jgi:LacI family transcriptional regulator
VDMSLRRPQFKCVRVVEDNLHASQIAAQHLLDRRVEQFAFYSDTANWAYDERGTGFTGVIKAAGKNSIWLRRHQAKDFLAGRGEWQRRLHWLAKSLSALPKPLGVLAANDQQALEVLEACELANLSVPETVAIVGVGNYLLAPDAMPTPISSVDTNLELLGYRAAATLDDLMRGGKVPGQLIRVPAKEVVARKSSDLLAISHVNIGRAVRFIWEHAHEPINVADVVRVAEKVESVAMSCGYQSLNSFCVAFKNATSKSPGQFRREARGAA